MALILGAIDGAKIALIYLHFNVIALKKLDLKN